MTPLLGPPELPHPPPPPPPSQSQTSTAPSNPSAPHDPPMGFTENRSATYLSTGNPCLDFFFHVVPNTAPENIKKRLRRAWAHNPLTTLKLVCNLRGVRGTGKSDKEGFYTAAFWLHRHHPKTLACSLDSFADFGYFKDLPEILFRLLEGPEVRKIQKEEWNQRKMGLKRKRVPRFKVRHNPLRRKAKRRRGEPKRKSKPSIPKEVRVLNAIERDKLEKEKASALRKEKKINCHG
ncbi:hypothetical protein PTKIN_Ptkin15bG0158600 [Pterospermum kingtungense]